MKQPATMHHLVTGANGYVGSNLVRALLRQGNQVIALARCSEAELYDQLDSAVLANNTPLNETELQNLTTRQYRLDQDHLGLMRIPKFTQPVCCWHSAAYMSFNAAAAELSWDVNVTGTQRLCNWLNRWAPPDSRLHYLSTAYTCGKRTQELSEQFYPQASLENFHNPYEYSKRHAEFVIREFAQRHQFPCLVFRPGQIVGMSTTGATNTHHGVYGFIRLLAQLQSQDVRRIRIAANLDTQLHLLPIDACVSGLLSHQQIPLTPKAPPRILHLVPSRPVPLRQLLSSLHDICGVQVEVLDIDDTQPTLSKIEKLVARQLRDVIPYVSRQYQFTSENQSEFSSCQLNLTPSALQRNLQYYYQQLVQG